MPGFGGGTLLERLYYQIDASTHGFDRNMLRAQATLGKFGGAANVATIGAGATALAVVGIGTAATVMAVKFEDAFAEVTTILDQTTEQNEALKESILDLSTRIPESATALTKGLYQTISAGITDAAEAMMVLEQGAKLATAGLSDTETTVDALTTILNAYGMESDRVGIISDQMFETVRMGKIRLDELAGSIGKAAPFFAALKVPTEELFGAIATLTKGGLDAQITMTALRGVAMGILKPEKAAKEAAAALGIQLDATAVKTKGLWKWLMELKEAVGEDQTALAGIFGDLRGLMGVLGLVGEQADTFTASVAAQEKALGSTERALAKMSETLSYQGKILWNQVSEQLIRLGMVIVPQLNKGIQALGGLFASRADKMRKSTKNLATELERLDTIVLPLAGRYDELAMKTKRNVAEERELQEIMQTLATETIPGLVAQVDGHMRVTELDTQALYLHRLAQGEAYSKEAAAGMEEQIRLIVEQQKKLEGIRRQWDFVREAQEQGWTGSGWEKALTKLDLGVVKLMGIGAEMHAIRQGMDPNLAEAYLWPFAEAVDKAYAPAITTVQEGAKEAQTDLERLGGEMKLMAATFPLAPMVKDFVELKIAAKGGPLSAEGQEKLKMLQGMLARPLPSLFDPNTADRALEAWAEVLGVWDEMASKYGVARGFSLLGMGEEAQQARQKDLMAFLDDLAEKPKKDVIPALTELEKKIQAVMKTAADQNLELMRSYARVILNITDGTESLEAFRAKFVAMSEDAQDELEDLAQAWKKLWESAEEQGPPAPWWLKYMDPEKAEEWGKEARRQLELTRAEIVETEEFKRFAKLVEAGAIEVPVEMDLIAAFKQWKRFRENITKESEKTIQQQIELFYTADISALEGTMGALALGLGHLTDLMGGAAGAMVGVFIPAMDRFLQKIEDGGKISGADMASGLFAGIISNMPTLARGWSSLWSSLWGTSGDPAKQQREAAAAASAAADAFRKLTAAIQEQTKSELEMLEELYLASATGASGKASNVWSVMRDTWRRFELFGGTLKPFSKTTGGENVKELLDELGLDWEIGSFKAALDYLDAIRGELNAWGWDMESLAGRMERLQWKWDLLELDDKPLEKWAQLRKEIEELTGVSLPDIDLRTAQGRKQMEQLLMYLSGLEEMPENIAASLGMSREALEELLGNLRAGEAVDLAKIIEGLMDDIEGNLDDPGNAIGDETEEIRVSRNVSITEMQGDHMVHGIDRTASGVWTLVGIAQALMAGGGFRLGDAMAPAPAPTWTTPTSHQTTIDVGGISIGMPGEIGSDADALRQGALFGEAATEALTRRVRALGGRIRGAA